MSRVGKQHIEIPQGTEVSLKGESIFVKGPKGELSREVRPEIKFDIADSVVNLTSMDKARQTQALWGTYASHLVNMIKGVNEGFSKELVVEGVGYRAKKEEDVLSLKVGFSHLVEIEIPKELEVEIEKNKIKISGIDKEAVGKFAAEVRSVKKPEPYKGKGIRYENEVVRRKEGKKG